VQAALHLCAAALPNHYCRDNFAVLLALGSAAGLLLRILASRVLALIVYSATPRDPLVLAGAVLAMSLMGLLATWIPARRALSVDPLILLREDE
jgi:ABC-type antimicrobial peptide transport system permease subunit